MSRYNQSIGYSLVINPTLTAVWLCKYTTVDLVLIRICVVRTLQNTSNPNKIPIFCNAYRRTNINDFTTWELSENKFIVSHKDLLIARFLEINNAILNVLSRSTAQRCQHNLDLSKLSRCGLSSKTSFYKLILRSKVGWTSKYNKDKDDSEF